MPRFNVAVDEIRRVRRHYIVDADTEEEARNLAEAGETIHETDDGGYSIVDRVLAEGTLALCPMQTYSVEQYELHTTQHRVRARSLAEAIQRVLSGQSFAIEETQEFIEVADRYGLPVDAHSDLCAELRRLGVTGIDVVIPSIREIRELA